MRKASTEEIVAAYRETGSVWAAGRRLGMAGQSVHERLVSAGWKLQSARWTEAEVEEMRALAATGMPLGEIARRLGRPFGGCAGKASEIGLRFRRRGGAEKLPRGAGFDKQSTAKHMRALRVYAGSVTQYARSQGLHIDPFVKACERHFPEEWKDYAAAHSKIPERSCDGCGRVFLPMSGKQRYCTRKCNTTSRRDEQYFGGKRSSTVGLAEGICQVCGNKPRRGLSSHHVIGKENDPDNEALIALCQGCHKIVGWLASRKMVDDPAALEALISLAWTRKHGADLELGGVRVYVDLTREEECGS